MKINLEILQSCTIKRKKPWSKVSWLGTTKEHLFIMDHQRLSLIDAKTGKTKRRVGKLTSSHLKNFTTYNTSDNGAYLVGVDKSGDLLVWAKDTNELRVISGLNEFALKLGSHASSVFVSNDLRRILLITSRNKVFVWEADGRMNTSGVLAGNWSNIVASKEVKSVEDSKDLVLHARFSSSPINGISATCCFVFNYESRLTVNVLRIKWLSPNEIIHQGECRFETIWLCYQPQLMKYTDSISISLENGQYPVTFQSLYTRGSFVTRLSHSSDLIALASNQKYAEHTSLVFMSTANGSLMPVNLRNFGLTEKARGRHYWIQDLRWLSDDLYLAGITKHGAIFLVSRLGQPLFIHAVGKEINMGPALYITLHPLIVVRGKSGMSFNKSDDTSLSSTIELNEGDSSKANLNSQQQKYSLACHPNYPVLVCCDGFLMCVLRINSAYATQPRLIRELMNNSIGLLNTLSDKPVDVGKFGGGEQDGKDDEPIPEWEFQSNTANQSSESSDSGVDSNEKMPKDMANATTQQRRSSLSMSQSKIAEGKIIFSFLPQIIPISMETLDMHESVATRIETAFESMQSAWGLLVSMRTSRALLDTAECDRTAKSIQFMFSRLAKILISLDFDLFKNLSAFKLGQLEAREENEEDDKLKVCTSLFIRMLKYIYFDPASPHNPNSHMLAYLRSFVIRFLLTLLKNETTNSFKRIELAFSILTYCESLLKSAYRLVNNNGSEMFFLCNDSIRTQKSQVIDEVKLGIMTAVAATVSTSDPHHGTDSQAIETDSLEKEQKEKDALLVRQRRIEKIQFGDLIFENCWLTLLHYAKKYNMKKVRPSIEANLLTILTQRKLASKFSSIPKLLSSKLQNINPGDMAYLDRGDLDYSIGIWSMDYENALRNLEKLTSQTKIPLSQKAQHFLKVANLRELTSVLVHKIFYACLANYRLDKLLGFIEENLIKCNRGGNTNKFSLFKSVFRDFDTSKPLPTLPESLVYLLRSLARFMADYLDATRSEIKICAVLGTIIDWPKLNEKRTRNELKVRLEKEKLVAEVNQKQVDGVPLSKFFCPDKVVELLIVTGLFEEAVYFLSSVINDWRSSFLLDSVLRESIRYEEDIADDPQYQDPLIVQINRFLSFRKNQSLIENNSHSDSSSSIHSMRSLLMAAIMTKRDPLPTILAHLMRDLTKECAQLSLIVPVDFYLPAPPIYCPQLFADSLVVNEEIEKRIKIGKILKEIMIVFESSRLYVPLIKWYLESLNEATTNMKENLGVRNDFKLNASLRQLVTQLRHQKIGNIPESILITFRDMCALVGFLETRDRFSHQLRQYTKFFMDHQDISMIDSSSREVLSMSLSLIDFGNLLLSYGVKHGDGGSNKPEIWTVAEIIISTISKLGKHGRFIPNIDLESRLARCVHKINRIVENFSDVVQTKLDRLVTEWRTIPSRLEPTVSMGDLFLNHILPNESVVSVKVASIFGPSEEILFESEDYKRQEPNHIRVVGGYDFERDERSIKMIEMFVRVAFDRTENWSGLSSMVNVDYPLLSEFYEPIREKELLGFDECKTYLITNGALNYRDFQTRRKRRKSPSTRTIIEKVERKGLFRWRSFEQLRPVVDSSHQRSSSLGASLNLSSTTLTTAASVNDKSDEDLNTKPSKCLDYGPKYLSTLALSIWLMQWSNDSKISLQQQDNKLAALKMKYLTVNELVGSVYLADGRDLWMESRRPLKPKKMEKKTAITMIHHTDEDTMTHVSSTESATVSSSSMGKEAAVKKEMSSRARKESTSSTLDISSLTENHVKAYLTKQEQHEVDKFVETMTVATTSLQAASSQPPQSTPIPKSPNPRGDETTVVRVEDEPTNILDLTEYFQLDELKTITRPIIIPKQKETDVEEEEEEQQSKKKSNRAVDFFTGIFRRGSQSRSRSPEKPIVQQPQLLTTTSALSKSSSPVRSLSPMKSVRIDDNNRPTSSINSFPAPIPTTSEQSSVQDMIRNELKRIVQIQHDTVMSILNGQPSINPQLSYSYQQPPPQAPQFTSSMNEQISALLKQQQTIKGQNGMEFIVETKIRTVDAIGTGTNTVAAATAYQQQQSMSSAEPVNYFMKTFDTARNEPPDPISSQRNSRLTQSKFVKIPLLNSRYLEPKPDVDSSVPVDRYNARLPYLEQPKQPMHSPPQHLSSSNLTQMQGVPLINFKSKSRGTEPQPLLDLDVSRETSMIHETATHQTRGEGQAMNPHIRKFLDLNSPNHPTKIGEFKLLKLNYNQPQQQPTDRSTKPTVTAEETKTQPGEEEKSRHERKSVAVEVEKPLYDGYILKPDAVKDMLDNDLAEQPLYTSAEAHYNATKHLREKPKIKTESRSTMTEIKPPLQATQTPTPPDVLLNLKFDTSNETQGQRDFVNVVDLDSDSIDHILKLIEHDQTSREKNRRKSKQEKRPSAGEEEASFEKGDALTKKLLEITRTEDEYKQYDEIMAQQIAAETERSRTSIQKRRALNDLQFIDDRIRAMNQIADEISGDYAKFGKLADKLSDLVDLREVAEKATEIDESDELQLRPEPKKKEKKVPHVISKPALKQVEILPLDESELSDLRESEEAKLEKILGGTKKKKKEKEKDTSHLKEENNANRSSVTEVLRDVLDDLDIDEDGRDLDESLLDEVLERSASPRKKSLPPTAGGGRSPSIRRRSPDKQQQHPINTTFEKPIRERKVSPTVQREKEMQMRRERMQEKFAEKREQEAKKLLNEMLSNQMLPKELRLDDKRKSRKSLLQEVPTLDLKPSSSSRSPVSLMARTISDLQRKEALKKSESDLLLKSLEARSLQQSQNISPPRPTSKSPSRRQTTTSRSPDQQEKQSSSSPPQRLLKPFSSLVHLQDPSKLRQRPENKQLTYQDQLLLLQEENTSPNRLKSFSSMVHLQDPSKLRQRTENEPLTYQDQLHSLQEQTVPPPDPNSAVEMKKVYGSKRVKVPGSKTSVRKGQVKTYSERLKELKPAQSQAKVMPRPRIQIQNQQPQSQSRKPATVGKHQLKTKELDKKPGVIPRYKPYSTTTIIKQPKDDDDDDELSEWILDDNLKRIIYDNGDDISNRLTQPKRSSAIQQQRPNKNPIRQPIRQPVRQPVRQSIRQSLEDDRELRELLEEERKNDEMVRRALHDLDEIEGRGRGRGGPGDDYVSKVGVDDLEATRSLSADSLSGFIDWDEIDNMINTLK